MALGWFRDAVKREVDAVLQDELDTLLIEAKRQLSKSNPFSEVWDEIKLAQGKEYTIADVESDRPETMSCWLDFSDMKDGDKLELEIGIRFPTGKIIQWERFIAEPPSTKAAIRLDNLVLPRGAKITATHVAGRMFTIGWYINRSRP